MHIYQLHNFQCAIIHQANEKSIYKQCIFFLLTMHKHCMYLTVATITFNYRNQERIQQKMVRYFFNLRNIKYEESVVVPTLNYVQNGRDAERNP